MQQVTIIGNVGQDARVQTNSNSGKEFMSFSVAVSERWKDSSGEQKEKTVWYNCIYQPQKMTIADYIRKGGKVMVQGKPQFSTYKDRNGELQMDISINVQQVELLSKKEDSSEPTPTPAGSAAPQNVPAGGNDDLPF